MKRLQDNQLVTLAVDDDAVDCRVAGLTGGEAALTAVAAGGAGALPAAAPSASMVFEHRGGLVMLRGAMYRAGQADELRFAASDRAPASGQQRKTARLELALPVTITPLDDDGSPAHASRRLVTADVSIGGLGLRMTDRLYGIGTLVRFELVPPGGEPLRGSARVAHVTGELCGLQFAELGPVDRVRLAGYLVGTQRTRARHTRPSAPRR